MGTFNNEVFYNVCGVRYHAGIGISRYIFIQPRDVLSFIFDWIFYWNFNNFNKESLKACICKLPLVKVLQRKCQICPVQKCFFVFIFSYQDYLLSSKTKKFPNIKRFKNELILHILLPFKTKTTEQSSPPCLVSPT